jgi:hypothetical protein
MDAGIATEANIQFLKDEGYPYLCVSRSNIKDYSMDADRVPVQIADKKNQPIELLRLKAGNGRDNYLWVKSHFKAEKENSMHKQFAKRFEEGLRGIQNGFASKGGIKRHEKVWERIGRLKEKYPSVHQYYEIKVTDNGKTQQQHCPLIRKTLCHMMKKQRFTSFAHRLVGQMKKPSGQSIMQSAR